MLIDFFFHLRAAKLKVSINELLTLLAALPALRNPTISSLSQKGWVAVETIIDEHVVREFIPKLKAAGAETLAVQRLRAQRLGQPVLVQQGQAIRTQARVVVGRALQQFLHQRR